VLAIVAAASFADVLFAGRTLSAAAYTHGVLPDGPDADPDRPPIPHLRDVEGAAWVDEPSPYVVHRSLVAGRAPLWNGAEGLGAPLAANLNAAVWAPLALPVNLWPGPLVQDLAWILRVWLLGLATMLLARRLGCGAIAALGAAIALMLSGQTLDWIAHHPLHGDVFAVLALVTALRVLEGHAGATAWLAAAIAAGLAGGKPQSALVTAICGLVWLVAAELDRRRESRPVAARFVPILLAGVLGVALAAVVLVPFRETYASASSLVRAGRSMQSALRLPIEALPALLGPWALRGLSRLSAAPVPSLDLRLPHAGAAVLLLAVVGLWRARRRLLAWAIAATIGLYLVKIHLGAPGLVGRLPLLSAVSFVKYCFPLYLGLAVLAGFGIDGASASWSSRARGERPVGRWRTPAVLQAACVVAIALELWALAPHRHPLRVDPLAPAPYIDALRVLEGERPGRVAGPVELMPPLVSNALGFSDLRAINVLTPDDTYDFVTELVAPSEGITWILADLDPLLVATAPGSALADVRYVVAQSELSSNALPGAVATHVTARRLARLWRRLDGYSIDTRSLWGGIHAFGGERRFHWTCTTPCRYRFDVAALPESFVAGLGASQPCDVGVELATRAASGVESRRRVQLPLAPDAAAWQDVWLDTIGGAGERGSVDLSITSVTPRSVFVGGVGPSSSAAEERRSIERELEGRRRRFATLVRRHADSTAVIYENPRALGGAWLASSVARVVDRRESFERLRGADDPRLAVVVDADARAAGFELPSRSDGSVEVANASDQEMEIVTRSEEGGLLVVSRLAYPGWRASLDGAALPIVRVDGALIGIAVPAGTHQVRLRYRPSSYLAGSAVSLVALAVWVALVMAARGRRRPRSRASLSSVPRHRFEATQGRG
jgi:hypothetical protein